MAENLPVNFAIPGETSVGSYSFSELLNSQGYIDFYLGLNTAGALTEFTYYAKTSITEISFASTGGAWTAGSTLDFDTLVRKPITVRGTAIATIPTWKGGTSNNGIRCVVSVCKYDGSTTTVLASDTTNENGPDTAERYQYLTGEIAIPETNFKIGEYLRIRVVIYYRSTQTTSYVKMGHDPSNQSLASTGSSGVAWNSSTLSKQAKIVIPFKVDI